MGASSKRQKVTDAKLIRRIKEAPDPFVTASELSEQLPLSRQQINGRLRDLEEQGIADRKKCGSGQGWWIINYPSS